MEELMLSIGACTRFQNELPADFCKTLIPYRTLSNYP